MTCTGCSKVWPSAGRAIHPDQSRKLMREDGWFVWHRATPTRFSGVVLCPGCRKSPTNEDAFGTVLPTEELEKRASKA